MKKQNKNQDTALAIPEMCDAKTPFVPGTQEAKELNRAHSELVELTVNFAGKFIPKASELGEKLSRVKRTVGHGNFEQWVKKHLDFDVRTARRYMARVKYAKRTDLSDLRGCTNLMAPPASSASKDLAGNTPALKLFSTAGSKVLQQSLEDISPADKETIRSDFERLEPIALQLWNYNSIFTLTWQKKLSEGLVRWSSRDIALFRKDVARANKILRTAKADAAVDTVVTSPQIEAAVTLQGVAP